MNIRELAEEYERSALLLRDRMTDLERAQKEAEEEQTRAQLELRLRPLRSMYRDTRAVVRYLKRYTETPAKKEEHA